jgi:tetratricopeptide (TPR) repeat protein
VVPLSNQATALHRQGKHSEALEVHRQVLSKKVGLFGEKSIQAALTFNAIGECLIELGELNEARRNLMKAHKVRREQQAYSDDDKWTRENLAKVAERQGKWEVAREWRCDGRNICSYVYCPNTMAPLTETLKRCGQCRSIYYCDAQCQQKDWTDHKPCCVSVKDQVQ